MTAIRRLKKYMMAKMKQHLPMMLTCQEFEDFVVDYFEDALAPRPRRIFELHLKMCPHCRRYLEAYRHTIDMGKAAFDSPGARVPDDMPEDLVHAILAARQAQ